MRMQKVVVGALALGMAGWGAGVVVAPAAGAAPNPPVIVQVSAGPGKTCALTAAGAAWCWGLNAAGETGDGTSGTNRITPVPVVMPDGVAFDRINAAAAPCAHATDGRLFCWGANVYGQVGDGTSVDRSVPTEIAAPAGAQAWAAIGDSDGDVNCAEASGGSAAGAYCWGWNWVGNNGHGDAGGPETNVYGHDHPVGVCSLDQAAFELTGPAEPCSGTPAPLHGLAAANAGCGLFEAAAYCWGSNVEIANPSASPFWEAEPWPVSWPGGPPPALQQVVRGSGGGGFLGGAAHTCALTNGGAVWCWGGNRHGERGEPTGFADFVSGADIAATPVAAVMPNGVTFTKISAGASFTCGLTPAGVAYCWGANDNGQLGDGGIEDRWQIAPVSMPSGHTFVDIDAGADHACGVTTTGEVWCWGGDGGGQLGDGVHAAPLGNSLVPVRANFPGSDPTPPTVTPGTDGVANAAGWFRDVVHLDWTTVDPDSLVTSDPCDPVFVDVDTTGQTFSCAATSNGGTTSASVTIKLDTVAPDVALLGVTDGASYSANAPTASCSTTDATSGVAIPATLSFTDNGGGSITAVCSGAVDVAGNLGADGAATFTLAAPPAGVSAVAGNHLAVVHWNASAHTGGAPIIGYDVTPYVGGSPLAPRTFMSTATTQTIGSLANGTEYVFVVSPIYAMGRGAPSNPSPPVTPRTVPGAPTAVGATPANAAAVVHWTVPASNGGAAISGYVVTPFVGAVAQGSRTFNSTATTQTVGGLTNGTAYTFKVAAKNVAGTGPVSTGSLPTIAGTPAPVVVGAVATSGRAAVSWTLPGNNGAAISSYTVQVLLGGVAVAAKTHVVTCAPAPCTPARTWTVTGLTNGNTYTFAVTPANARGSGPRSATAVLVSAVAARPGVPASVTAAAATGSATLAWIAPANGTASITGYVVTPYKNGIAQSVVAINSIATTQVISGLQAGQPYTFRVAARNAVGTGAQSAATSTVIPT